MLVLVGTGVLVEVFVVVGVGVDGTQIPFGHEPRNLAVIFVSKISPLIAQMLVSVFADCIINC